MSSETVSLSSQVLNLWIQLNLSVHKDWVVQKQHFLLNFTAGLQLKACIGDRAAVAACYTVPVSITKELKKKMYVL